LRFSQVVRTVHYAAEVVRSWRISGRTGSAGFVAERTQSAESGRDSGISLQGIPGFRVTRPNIRQKAPPLVGDGQFSFR
jgi:hypothetical protein